MNRTDLESLHAVRGYPALSILMPTHGKAPENRQDAIRLKKLAAQATALLLGNSPRHEVEPLLTRLETLLRQIDYRQISEGLALFVNRDLARVFYLPFAPQERVVVDDAFATHELLAALNSSPRYWVLVLGKSQTRLLEGWRDTLVPVNNDCFPMSDLGNENGKPLPVGYGIEKSKHRAERERQFLREVDTALAPFAATEPLPLIVIGTERTLACFEQVTRHGSRVAATVIGNHAKTAVHELARLVWPLAQKT